MVVDGRHLVVRVMCHHAQETRGNTIQVMRSGRRMRTLSITCKTFPPLPFGCKPLYFLLPPLPRPPPLIDMWEMVALLGSGSRHKYCHVWQGGLQVWHQVCELCSHAIPIRWDMRAKKW